MVKETLQMGLSSASGAGESKLDFLGRPNVFTGVLIRERGRQTNRQRRRCGRGSSQESRNTSGLWNLEEARDGFSPGASRRSKSWGHFDSSPTRLTVDI